MSWITALLVALILGGCLIKAANAIAWAIAETTRNPSPPHDTARTDAVPTPGADASMAEGSLAGASAGQDRTVGGLPSGARADGWSRADHERWLTAMNADSVLGATTRRTLDQLGELMTQARGLSVMAQDAVAEATLLDVDAEPFHQLFDRSKDVGQRIGALRLSVSAAPYFADKGQSDDCVTALFAFNRALAASFTDYVGSGGSSRLPDELRPILFPQDLHAVADEAQRVYDRWTRVGEMQQAVCAPDDYVAAGEWLDRQRVASEASETGWLAAMLQSLDDPSRKRAHLDQLIEIILQPYHFVTAGCPDRLTHAVNTVGIDMAAQIVIARMRDPSMLAWRFADQLEEAWNECQVCIRAAQDDAAWSPWGHFVESVERRKSGGFPAAPAFASSATVVDKAPV
ncbi:hypothetical protein GCM10007242_11830 [Pigmentiphaga litoralis]|uniref:hypothetical protein n=1 Tax=Pigmentiphaga litoralis TaxID=516702 RepID=UPI001677E831|nr:hypothetical protein [Pigmentiphaga litoralis]GGX07852.1 hypothetical protein GCM10007242_11830 [Pigmentiphaga litoralis]